MRKLLPVLLLLPMLNAEGADKDGNFRMLGSRTCGTYTSDRKEHGVGETNEMAWMGGYVTAYNDWSPDTYSILGGSDLQSIALWMDQYCQRKPLSDLTSGMHELILELRPNRKRTIRE